MTEEKRRAVAAIEEKAELIARTADSIWGFAELSLQEERSAALYCKTLEDEGFTVERIESSPTEDPALGIVWRARRLAPFQRMSGQT